MLNRGVCVFVLFLTDSRCEIVPLLSFSPSVVVQMSSLCRLPDAVLSSCILPLLDVTSLLRVARCSHLLLSAADSNAAWAHSSLDVSLNHLSDASVLRSLALRRANLAVREGGFLRRSIVVRKLQTLPPACKLVSFQTAGVRTDALHWAQIVAHPAFQHLRSLTLTNHVEVDAAHLRALAALPRLTELCVSGRVVAPAAFTAFAASSSLTSVECYDSRRDGLAGALDPCSVLRFVLACPTVVRLSVTEPASAFIEGCSPVFALAGMERIHNLTLSSMDAGGKRKQPAPPEVASASPAALLTLHSLTIGVCYDIDKFLPHLRLAPALRSLRIEPPLYKGRSVIPSPEVLVTLLVAAPALAIRIRGYALDPRDRFDPYDAIVNSAELRAFASRFAVEE